MTRSTPEPIFTDTLELDLWHRRAVARRSAPSAGSRRLLGREGQNFATEAAEARAPIRKSAKGEVQVKGANYALKHGASSSPRSRPAPTRRIPASCSPPASSARNAVERGLKVQALGEDLARAGQPGGHRLSRRRRLAGRSRQAWVSTSSAMAARPASAIRARCPIRSPTRSRKAISSSPPCSRAIAISKAASIRKCARIISPRRRWSLLMRWPAR